MLKKKSFLFKILSLLILTSILFPIVSAQDYLDEATEQTSKVLESVLGILSPLFEQIIGDYSTSEFFFHKVLLLILLIVIAKNVLDKTPFGNKNKKVSMVLSLIISILAIRFINENSFFQSIFLQYGVLGIAITTLLPIIIFFYFIHNAKIGSFGRKAFWAFYFIIMTGIWIMRASEIPSVAHWIYGFTLLATTIFLFLDKQIHVYFGMKDFMEFERERKSKLERTLRKQLGELKEDYVKGYITDDEYEKTRKRIVKRLRTIYST